MEKIIAFIKELDLTKVRAFVACVLVFSGLIIASDEAPSLNTTCFLAEKVVAVLVIFLGAWIMPHMNPKQEKDNNLWQ